MDEIQKLLVQGRKIEAIKRYREIFGASLADAKEAVEALEKSLILQKDFGSQGEQADDEATYQQTPYDNYEDMLDPDYKKKRKKQIKPGREKGRINYPLVVIIALIVIASYFGLLAFTKRYEANLAQEQRRAEEQSEVRL